MVKQAELMLRIGGRKKVLGLSFLSSSQYFQCQVGFDFFERILLLPKKNGGGWDEMTFYQNFASS